MYVAMVAVTLGLGAMLAYAAARKLSRSEQVVAEYRRAGVQQEWLTPLAILLLLATVGLLVGLLWRPIGIAAAAGLVVYFLGAVIAHVRARDTRNLAVPLLLEILSVALLVMRIAVDRGSP